MSSQLPPALFIAGPLGIDFLNSVAIPVDSVVDWISTGEDYLDWLRQAELLTTNDISIIKSNFSAGELDEIARRARELREWFRGFARDHKGKPLPAKALTKLKPLTDLLGLDQMFWSIVPKTSKDKSDGRSPMNFRLQTQRRWRTAESLLALVAEEIAKVICSADFTCIKACQGENCILFFYDETRRHDRRWCSMAICGNRAKQKAYRERSGK
ncbi:MAG TPA: CGNR zinc finger domain-containing protein [Candidatus Sulfotelmatobacter sp.]|nr:CGNR zinc finger domain-containing protein [Candidatus Sulfotelmatobacter sp.]